MNTTQAQLSDLYASDPLKACRTALKLTASINPRDRMEAINSLLGLYGVEGIRGDWQNGFWCDIVATYANTGNSYGLTVIHQRGDSGFDEDGRFFVGMMGDFVERNEKKLGIL